MVSAKRVQVVLVLWVGAGTEGWQVVPLHRAKVDLNGDQAWSQKLRSIVKIEQLCYTPRRIPRVPTARRTTKSALFARIPYDSQLQREPLSHRCRLCHRAGRFAIRCVLSLALALCVLVVGQTSAVASTSATSGSAPVVASAARLAAEPPLTAAWELRLSVRLICAALTGAAIGKERSGVKYHPAGVRTMALVALGAALFTICSRHGFAGTHYDTSRMASNVASGVGFIGAGVIYHEQHTEVVHGLTTAAAIWISAAVGVACGCGLFVLSSMATLVTLGILRIGGAVKVRKRRKRKVPLEHLSEQQENSVFSPEEKPSYPPPPQYSPALENSYMPPLYFPSASDFISKKDKKETGLDYSSKYEWLRDLDEREMHAYFLKSIAEFSRAAGENQALWKPPPPSP